MNYYCLDAEWNPDDNNKLHVIAVKRYPKGKKYTFTDMSSFTEFCHTTQVDKWFIHAGLTADVPVINRNFGEMLIDPKDVVDTFVVSRLVDYNAFSTHSLKELGEHLGVYKGDYEGGWSTLTPEMIKYCEQDVEVLEAIVDHFWSYITDPAWADAMRTEHDISSICSDMQTNGFLFDVGKANDLLNEIKDDMTKLEKSFSSSFPPKLVEVKRLKYRTTKEGSVYKTVQNAMDDYPKVEVVGDELVVYDWKEFNPGSPKERIEVLWEAGWKPVEKTKGHINAERRK